MPSKKVTYKCNVCGVEYRDFDAAEKCEKTHKIPVKVDKAKYEKGDTKKEYPESVLIHFTDDTSARYYRKGW